MEGGGADEEGRDAEGEKDAEGLDDALSGKGLRIDENPDLEMMGEQPLAVFLEVGDMLDDKVDEEEGEGLKTF